MVELKLRQKTTLLDMVYEATKSIYSYCYLASEVSYYEDDFKIIPEKLIERRNGQGNLDYAIECRSTGRILWFSRGFYEGICPGICTNGIIIDKP